MSDISDDITDSLFESIEHSQYEVTKCLLFDGVDSNVKNQFGSTPLYCAINRRDVDMINVLLEYEADPNIRNNDGVAPIHLVCGNIHWPIQMVKNMIKKSPDINIQDNNGKTPLHYASGINNRKVISALLSEGALMIKDKKGSYPYDFGYCNYTSFDLFKPFVKKKLGVKVYPLGRFYHPK